ncbi:type II toxin-antitoxin system HicA family toxin [bacterium]|nr:type II toxin-antitoxin system HicA family toxin [bacterium]
MGDQLKLCSGAEAVRIFQKIGWTVSRQKGSHVMMTKPDYQWTLSIPQHKELGPGLLRKLIRQAGISVEEFNSLL